MLGLFIVQITAAGCLYFLDPTNIANDRGLAAAGTLLMLLNVAYVVAMLILIAINGASKTKHYTCAVLTMLKVSSLRLKQSLSGRVSAGGSADPSPGVAQEGVEGNSVCTGGSDSPGGLTRGFKL